MRARWWFLVPLLLQWTSVSVAQQWFSVQTDHLVSYSDGSDRGAREAALRGEQIIAVFGQVFHHKDMTLSTPLRVRAIHVANASGKDVLVRTPMANIVTVDLSQPDSWEPAAKAITTLTLEDNYPRAQPWFDSGITSYLGGVRFTGEQMRLGALPPGIVLPHGDEWIPLGKVFQLNDPSPLTAAQRQSFEAESWAVIRWLIDNSRLAQAGVYLNAVQSRGATPERAMAEAFSMDFADLDREVRESLAQLSVKDMPAPRVDSSLFKSQKVSAADMHVLEANLSLFGAESDGTLRQMVAFMRQNQDNAAVHRALAWAFLLRRDLENAVEHIRRALALDDSDASMHYLYARWVNQGEENKIRVESAQTRMGTELKAALQRDPHYATALELLGLAELSDGAVKSAEANLQRASALSPRNSRYYLNLGRAHEAAGNLDGARNLILYARAGGDPAIAGEADELLNQLGKQKKQQKQWEAMGLHADAPADPNVKHSKYDNLHEAIEEEERAEAQSKSKSPAPQDDKRKIEYLKGHIVRVQCSSPPSADLTVNSAGQTWQMHVADRNVIVLIGVDHFDCGWHDTAVSINYKQSGKLRGDLISLEAD